MARVAVLRNWIPVAWWLVLWDLVIATTVASIAVQYRTESLWDVAAGLGMAVALVARRRAPVPVFAVVAALGLAQVVFGGDVPALYDVAVLVAMLAVVTHARTVRPALVAGGVVTAGLVLVGIRWSFTRHPDPSFTDLFDYVYELLPLFAVCAALWMLAYVLRANGERRATAAREREHLAMLAASKERAFIARELHDVVAHSLAVMIAQADGATYAKEPEARAAMRVVAGTGRDALDDMHRIVAVLRGDATDDDPDRRRRGLDHLETLIGRSRGAGIAVGLRIEGATGVLTAGDELTLYRLVQEGLTNVLRHAGKGASAEVTITVADGRATLVVVDDGGDGSVQAPSKGGNGLRGMRERIAAHGGEFGAGPLPGGGWRIEAVIPIKTLKTSTA